MENKSIINSIAFINSHIHRYEFYQIVRILESLHKGDSCIGTKFHPQEDIVKFKQNPTMRNSISDISRCRLKEGKVELVTNFISLVGANGIMPYFMTELIHDQLRNKNFAMLDFLNIFHNRMIALLYRSWAISNQVVSYEKGKYDHISRYIYSIIGYQYDLFNSKSSLHYDFKLFFAAHFVHPERTVESLTSIIRSYFCVEAEVEEFFPQWVDIPAGAKMELNSTRPKIKLGENTFLGDKAWNCTIKFKLIIGPMKYNRYNNLLPGTVGFAQLKDIVSLCSPPELQYDVEYVIKADEVPFFMTKNSPQLGYNSWLITKKPKENQKNFYIKNFHNMSN